MFNFPCLLVQNFVLSMSGKSGVKSFIYLSFVSAPLVSCALFVVFFSRVHISLVQYVCCV